MDANARAALPIPTLLQRFRLPFADPLIEREFLLAHRKEAVQVFRWAVVVAALMVLMFMWQDSEISKTGYRATNIRIYLLLPLCAAVWTALGTAAAARHVEWLTIFFVLCYSALTAALCLVFEPGMYGIDGTIASGNFLMIVFASFTMGHQRVGPAAATGAGVVAMYAAANYWFSPVDFSLFLYGNFSTVAMAYVLGLAACTMLETLRRRHFLAVHALAAEKERYKLLLFTLVPSQIAIRIEHGEFPIADSQAETAILFSDFVNFTALTKRIPPRTLVQLLNELFFEFDLAAERHGVEKIKTIGDGYMAACGPPVPEQRRTPAMASFGLELVEITARVAERYQLPIQIRVGIHTGALIAGVIGKSRYTFDMWGESVNMASRMESSGLPGRVQLSETAYRRLDGQFACEARGAIDVKGVGDVQAYLLCAAPSLREARPLVADSA